ncbi:hypothetical protein ABZ341_42190 [Streptomyces sp. NPDC006173]|uniref:hypothetical protein n=1 Tax=Streptomyces sp. NPDC006173 TaxID=3155349 RepID=UPI0033FBE748
MASVFVGVMAATSSASASPQASAEFFPDAGYGGGSSFYVPSGSCVTLPAHWRNTISSFTASGRVNVYSTGNCVVTEPGHVQTYTGSQPYVGDAMNDRIVSVRVF